MRFMSSTVPGVMMLLIRLFLQVVFAILRVLCWMVPLNLVRRCRRFPVLFLYLCGTGWAWRAWGLDACVGFVFWMKMELGVWPLLIEKNHAKELCRKKKSKVTATFIIFMYVNPIVYLIPELINCSVELRMLQLNSLGWAWSKAEPIQTFLQGAAS